MAAITFVVAAGLSLVMFVSLANVTTMLFARGAIRAAVEEAARVGARSDAPVAPPMWCWGSSTWMTRQPAAATSLSSALKMSARVRITSRSEP